jgi:hypothetical protein
MFEITVWKLNSEKHAKSTASDRQVLFDHLHASAARNGFVVTTRWDDGDDIAGGLNRDGIEVAIWKIEEVEA